MVMRSWREVMMMRRSRQQSIGLACRVVHLSRSSRRRVISRTAAQRERALYSPFPVLFQRVAYTLNSNYLEP